MRVRMLIGCKGRDSDDTGLAKLDHIKNAWPCLHVDPHVQNARLTNDGVQAGCTGGFHFAGLANALIREELAGKMSPIVC